MQTTNTKLLITALIALSLFVTNNVKAQSISKSNVRFGIGIDGLLPTGNLNNTANFALGITPRLQYGITNNIALTFTSGLYHFFTKPLYLPVEYYGAGQQIQNDLDIVPVKAGIKGFVSSNVYVGAEIGAGFEVDNGGGPVKLIASPTIGYVTKKWDVGLRYESFTGQSYNYGALGLRIAYGFGG